MKIYEINPFIRFAAAIRLFDSTEVSSSCDCRLFYVLTGYPKLIINGTEHALKENSAVLFPSGTAYKFNIEKTSKLISINFDYTQNNRNILNSISPVTIDRFGNDMILENISFEDAEILNKPIKIDNALGLKDKLEKITNIYKNKEMYYSERCSAQLKEAVIDILQNALFPSKTVLNNIETVIDFIQRNYSSDITNSDIASAVNYHPYYLNRLMVKYTNLTLHRYLLSLRLEKAKEYLLNTAYSIGSISEKCGFSSPGHFSNTFKTEYGFSPKAYREKHRNIL